MANPEHLKKLEEGVEAWNQWRMENPRTDPHLTNAELQKLKLKKINFENTNLQGTNLWWANLKSANIKGANLQKACLRGANLRETNLEGANLNEANLEGAYLERANLVNVKLNYTNLQGAYIIDSFLDGAAIENASLKAAYLNGSNLQRANLRKSNLNDAILDSVNFNGADLSHANLSGALVNRTVFVNLDLKHAIGLDKVEHSGPSSIGTDTIYKSRGQISIAFLRGCGLSDWEIEQVRLYNPGLSNGEINDTLYQIYNFRAGETIKFHRCFISYSHNDEEFAQKLYADLQDSGVRCWFAPENIKGGRKINEQIVDAIDLQDKLLLILSESSIKSDWVAYEIKKARVREKKEKRQIFFPLRLVEWKSLADWEKFDADTATDLAAEIRSYFIPDFSNWKDHDSYKKAFSRLLSDLKAE